MNDIGGIKRFSCECRSLKRLTVLTEKIPQISKVQTYSVHADT
jgi:hypothetical protein